MYKNIVCLEAMRNAPFTVPMPHIIIYGGRSTLKVAHQ